MGHIFKWKGGLVGLGKAFLGPLRSYILTKVTGDSQTNKNGKGSRGRVPLAPPLLSSVTVHKETPRIFSVYRHNLNVKKK